MSNRPETIDELLTGPAATAVSVAMVREEETARRDRLYADPWAASFVARARRAYEAAAGGEEMWHLLQAMVQAGNPWRSIAVRVVDDLLRSFVAGGCEQLVIPGVGLDTRALRIAWPRPVTVYELDVPEMITFRRSALSGAPTPGGARRVQVAADLARDWDVRLLAAGFDPARPSAWVVESVLSYVPRDAARAFMARLSELSAPRSRLALTYTREAAQAAGTSTDLYARLRVIPGIEQLVPGGRTHLGADGEEFLSELGWKLEYREGTIEAARLGRPLEPAQTTDFIVGTRIGS